MRAKLILCFTTAEPWVNIWPVKILFIVCCFSHCLWDLVLGLVLFCSTLCPFCVCNHLAGEKRAGRFTFVAFWM